MGFSLHFFSWCTLHRMNKNLGQKFPNNMTTGITVLFKYESSRSYQIHVDQNLKFTQTKMLPAISQFVLVHVNEDLCLIFQCSWEIRGKDITMVTFIRHLWDICSQGENTTICNIIGRNLTRTFLLSLEGIIFA